MRSDGILQDIVIVRGGGDLATGVVQKFFRAGIKVLILEIPRPTAIRRTVSLSRAVFDGTAKVEDITARLIENPHDCAEIWDNGEIPVLVDPNADSIGILKPHGVVDAIIAKKNLGTHAKMAPVVIALGPGFTAPADAHAVVETMRGHDLGRLIFDGSALPDTKIPGAVAGRAAERVLRAPCDGIMENLRDIGDIVNEGEILFLVAGKAVAAPFSGVLRGIIANGISVSAGLKVADVDPRLDIDCGTISDKARCLGGAALEAYFYCRRQQGSQSSVLNL